MLYLDNMVIFRSKLLVYQRLSMVPTREKLQARWSDGGCDLGIDGCTENGGRHPITLW